MAGERQNEDGDDGADDLSFELGVLLSKQGYDYVRTYAFCHPSKRELRAAERLDFARAIYEHARSYSRWARYLEREGVRE